MAQRLKTDWLLFLTILGMVVFGLVIVYSASSVVADLRYGSSTHYFVKQLAWALLSLFLLMACKRIDYRRLRTPVWVFPTIGVVLVLLMAVYFADSRSHRWIRLSGFGLQPSEFAKPALALFLAYFLSLPGWEVNSRKLLLPVLTVLGFVVGLVVVPDFGTALVLVLTALTLFYVAGLNRKYLAGAAVLMVLFAAVSVVAKPYRLIRVLGYVDPEGEMLEQIDPSGSIKNYAANTLATRDTNYQARQSKIAVGTGGVTGAGLMHGRQKLLYLPEAHTDFIYAVVGEELGLLGAVGLLGGFVVILWRGLRLFRDAPDPFGKYLALAVTTTIIVQAFINISVVLDLGPTKGIPLPLISNGGSSLLSTLISLGMLLSVSEQSG